MAIPVSCRRVLVRLRDDYGTRIGRGYLPLRAGRPCVLANKANKTDRQDGGEVAGLRAVSFQPEGQVLAALDGELLVDVGEMDRHGAHRDVQLLCDPAVAESLGGQFGDPPFAGRQRIDAGKGGPSWPRPPSPEFLAGPVSKRGGAAAVSEVERRPQKGARNPWLPLSAKRRAKLKLRTGASQHAWRALEDRDSLVQAHEGILAVFDQAQRRECLSYGARHAGCPGVLEFFQG